VLLDALARVLDELLEAPAGARHADHRHLELAAPRDQALERRKDLAVGEVAGGAEEDEGVGCAVARAVVHESSFFVSPCPPNPARIADSTGSGSGRAARGEALVERRGEHVGRHARVDRRLHVQRPSPESATRPSNDSSAGSRRRAPRP
jgi:hypothetical protein